MKVALAFWGITRSLKKTIQSIHTYILDVLRENGIDYTIFLHTFTQATPLHNMRAREKNCILDPEEYKLLNPDFVSVEDQVEIRKQLDLMKYRTHRDYWNTNYETVDNYICAMYSKQKTTTMIQESNIPFDCVLFLRPDVRFLNPLRIEWLTSIDKDRILVPNFHLYPVENPRMNDRFSITNLENGIRIGNIFDDIYEYSKKNVIHSENILHALITKTLKIRIVYIPFFFNRVRADGHEWVDVPDAKVRAMTR